jgi:hypothetical protein
LYYLLCFLFNKIGEQEGRTGSVQKWRGRGGGGREGEGGGPNNVDTHVSKCKNGKIKERKKIKRSA